MLFYPHDKQAHLQKREIPHSRLKEENVSLTPPTHTHTHIHTHKDIRTNNEQTSQPRRHIYAHHLSETHKVFVLFIPVKAISAMYFFHINSWSD